MNSSGLLTGSLSFAAAATLLFSPLLAESPRTFEFEAESMNIADTESMWKVSACPPASNHAWLVGSIKGADNVEKVPATYTLEVPAAGTWFLWARYGVHSIVARAFTVVIQGQEFIFAERPYGKTPSEKPETYGDREPEAGAVRLIWTRRPVELAAGKAAIELLSFPTIRELDLFEGRRFRLGSPVVDAFILTSDPTYNPPSEVP